MFLPLGLYVIYLATQNSPSPAKIYGFHMRRPYDEPLLYQH